MTVVQQIVTIGAVALGTALTRFLAFIVFPAGKRPPAFITYLGGVLPAATMGFLVVLSVKDVSLFSGAHGVPEALGMLTVAGVHLWKKNMLLSIAVGTAVYMVLLRTVFA